jgi:hypothetical protein
MAHKAKSKKKVDTAPEKKPALRNASDLKRKTSQQAKSTPETKSERAPEIESIQKRKQNQGKEIPPSFSLTEPVIRVHSNPAVKPSALEEKGQHVKAANVNPNFRIFLKRENNCKNADITGTRALTRWKKSSGRSKSWAVCRRLKLSWEDFELLTQSKTRPVSLGWQFSDVISPAAFVRSQGVRVYEQSDKRAARLSGEKGFINPEDECGPEWPLPRDTVVKGRKWRQEIEHRGGGEVTFLRMTFDHGHVSMTHEAFLEKIILSTASTSAKDLGASILSDLVFIRLLRNESHADVYLVQNARGSSTFYHAHAFLIDVSGNWSTFAKRKMDRLQKSQGFHAEMVQYGRKIIIMDIDLKAKEFCLKNIQKEFPPLPGTGKTLSIPQVLWILCSVDDQIFRVEIANETEEE